jgi:hypothetical protein
MIDAMSMSLPASHYITIPELAAEKGLSKKKRNTFSRLIGSVSKKRPFRKSAQVKVVKDVLVATVSEGTEESDEKSVRFSSTAALRYTIRRKDYTPQEKLASFYQRNEYSKIIYECVKEVRKMAKGGQSFENSRGLEPLLQSNKMRCRSIHAVLELQEDQYMFRRKPNVEAMAQTYISIASTSQLLATRVGLEDRQAVEEDMDH